MEWRQIRSIARIAGGLVCGAGVGYMLARSPADEASQKPPHAGLARKLPLTKTSSEELLPTYSEEFSAFLARCVGGLNLNDSRNFAVHDQSLLRTIARRDALVEFLTGHSKPHEAIAKATSLRPLLISILGVDLLNEVALAHSLAHPVETLNGIREACSRPDQLVIYDFIEGSALHLLPELCVAAAVLRAHEDAAPSDVWEAISLLKGTGRPISLPIAKQHKPALFRAVTKYLAISQTARDVLSRFERTDDTWEFLAAVLRTVSPNDAIDMLRAIERAPGWERQEDLVAGLIQKWTLLGDAEGIEEWITSKTFGRGRSAALRGFRDGLLAVGQVDRALELSTLLREQYADRNPVPMEGVKERIADLRATSLSHLPPRTAIKLLDTWKLPQHEVTELLASSLISTETKAYVEALEVGRQCHDTQDWTAAFTDPEANLSRHSAMASLIVDQDLSAAIKVVDQLDPTSKAFNALSNDVAHAVFMKYGPRFFTEEDTLRATSAIPNAPEVRSAGFHHWVRADPEASSGWLLDNISQERNSHLVEVLIFQLQHSDPEAAAAWAGAIADPTSRNRALEAIFALQHERRH